MAVRLLNAAEAYLYVTNIISLPLLGPQKNSDPEPVPLAYSALVMSVGILLERFIDSKEEGRSLADDQVGVYEAVAKKLEEQFGLDGRACVLRFICELQQRQLRRGTVAGQLLTILFTPGAGEKEGQLYLAAKGLGRRKDAACASHYGSCPYSVFLYFEALRNLTTTIQHSRHP